MSWTQEAAWLVSEGGEARGGRGTGQAEEEVTLVSEFSLTGWDSASWVCSPVSLEPCLLATPSLWLAFSTPWPGLLWPSPGLSPARHTCAPVGSRPHLRPLPCGKWLLPVLRGSGQNLGDPPWEPPPTSNPSLSPDALPYVVSYMHPSLPPSIPRNPHPTSAGHFSAFRFPA